MMSIVVGVIKSEDSTNIRILTNKILVLVQRFFPQEKFLLWEPYFNPDKNEVKVLNNHAACFYICKDLRMARDFFNMGMRLNAVSAYSDPVIIYNNCLIESEVAGSEEESGLIPLHCLQEGPERNCLIFALQLKQAEFFSNAFYLNRRFNVSFFRNQTLATVLNKAYDYLNKEKDKFKCKKRCFFNQFIGSDGQVYQKMVNYNFIVCLVGHENNFSMVLWKLKNYCHFKCKRVPVPHQNPRVDLQHHRPPQRQLGLHRLRHREQVHHLQVRGEPHGNQQG